MIKAKRTIKKNIFLSQISIVIGSLLMTALAFNICLNIYVRSQAKSQLVNSAAFLQQYISTDLSILNLEDNIKREDREAIKSLFKINKTLKQTQFILDINYAIIGKDKNKIYNIQPIENTKILEEDILPVLKKTKDTFSNLKKSQVFYFSASDKNYASLFYALKLPNNKNIGYLVLYSDLAPSKQLILTVNIILASIILIATIIAFIISNVLSKKISDPISQLSVFAKQIGDREYSISKVNFADDEIGDLGKTMCLMAEKLSAYDSTMKTFLQNASHELRTPLMSIQGYAEGIKYGVVENQNKAVEIIIDESIRLSNLVEDLLYLSKIDGLQEEPNIETVNADSFMRSCIERVSGIALNLNKSFRLSIDNPRLSINIDEEMFSQAIINILANSLRYANSNIDIALSSINEQVIIIIKDDGEGFENEDVSKIFDRFYKGKGGNYGLGLAITKTIIEKHNGTICADNNLQQGAYFKITLPKRHIE